MARHLGLENTGFRMVAETTGERDCASQDLSDELFYRFQGSGYVPGLSLLGLSLMDDGPSEEEERVLG